MLWVKQQSLGVCGAHSELSSSSLNLHISSEVHELCSLLVSTQEQEPVQNCKMESLHPYNINSPLKDTHSTEPFVVDLIFFLWELCRETGKVGFGEQSSIQAQLCYFQLWMLSKSLSLSELQCFRMRMLQHTPAKNFKRLKEILSVEAPRIEPGTWQPLQTHLFIHSSPMPQLHSITRALVEVCPGTRLGDSKHSTCVLTLMATKQNAYLLHHRVTFFFY